MLSLLSWVTLVSFLRMWKPTTRTACAVVVSALLVCFVHGVRASSVDQRVASPSSSIVAPQVAHAKRITAYTLTPDLYRKAHLLSRVRFASSLFGVFHGIFVLSLI